MKKVIFIAILSLVSVFCVAAKTADSDVTTSQSSSSVTATIAGVDEAIDFDTSTLVAIYKLMPDKVKKFCVSSYKAIAPKVEQSVGKRFTYNGVAIIPVKTANGINLKFSYGDHSLVVKNYTKAEFDRIFGL